VSWKLAGSLALLIAALAYLAAKLWRPFDAEGRPRPLWKGWWRA
jgi:hypothetical protein